VYATFEGGKPLIEELKNILEKKMENPWIINHAFLVYLATFINLLFICILDVVINLS